MENAEKETSLIRRMLWAPHEQKNKPTFLLSLYDLDRIEDDRHILGYRLEKVNNSKEDGPEVEMVLFSGADFTIEVGAPIDTYETIMAIMMFLTLKPGDVDDKHFEDFTDEQKKFCEKHAELLAQKVDDWYRSSQKEVDDTQRVTL